MNRQVTRTKWVWAALILQSVAFALAAWAAIQMLASWPKYAAYGRQLIPVLVRMTLEAILLGACVIGLWRSKRWGWVLGLLVNGFMCVMELVSLFELRDLFIRNPRFLTFKAFDFMILAVLVHRPVRRYFLGKRGIQKGLSAQGARQARRIDSLERSLRILVYFTATVAATWLITTFSLALLLGHKLGGAPGFLFLLVIAAPIGGAAAFLFILLMTLVVRMVDPNRLGLWLACGAMLAPGVIVGLARLAYAMNLHGHLGMLFAGPVYLLEVWWLALPAGLVTGFICYEIYPWSFKQTEPQIG